MSSLVYDTMTTHLSYLSHIGKLILTTLRTSINIKKHFEIHIFSAITIINGQALSRDISFHVLQARCILFMNGQRSSFFKLQDDTGENWFCDIYLCSTKTVRYSDIQTWKGCLFEGNTKGNGKGQIIGPLDG